MANTRRKRLPGEIVMDAIPRKRGRPRTRPERTTPKRPYKRSHRYTKVAKAERKAKAAFKRERKGEFLSDMQVRNMHGREYGELYPTLERRRGRRNVMSNLTNEGFHRPGRKAKISNIVPSF
jgi:hypothetical protein